MLTNESSMGFSAKQLTAVIVAYVMWVGCKSERYRADTGFELIANAWSTSSKFLDSYAPDHLDHGYCERLISMLEKYGSEAVARKDREYFEKYLDDPKWLIRAFRFDGANLTAEAADRLTTSKERLEKGWLVKDIYVVWLAELASNDIVMVQYASNGTKVRIDTLRESVPRRDNIDRAMFSLGRCYADFNYLSGSTIVCSYWTPTSSGHRLIKGLEYVIDCPTMNTMYGRKRETISSDLNLIGCILMPKLLRPE